jgi:hypothetical protein
MPVFSFQEYAISSGKPADCKCRTKGYYTSNNRDKSYKRPVDIWQLQDGQVCYAEKVGAKGHQEYSNNYQPNYFKHIRVRSCDGTIRLDKLGRFDKVKYQINLVYQSDRNAAKREREMIPTLESAISLFCLPRSLRLSPRRGKSASKACWIGKVLILPTPPQMSTRKARRQPTYFYHTYYKFSV